jgi:deazaflavin-dependent oxidoreductase (nitroreductase family)
VRTSVSVCRLAQWSPVTSARLGRVTSDFPTTQTCRIATRGRRTGTEHVVTVWFAMIGARFHAASRHGLAGDWVQNALAAGALEVRSGKASWRGSASLVPADDVAAVLDAFAAKYHRHGAVIAAWRENPPVFVRADLA